MLSGDEEILVRDNIAQKKQLSLREVEMCILISRLKEQSDWITFTSPEGVASTLREIKEDVQEVYRNLGKNEYGGNVV